jgi:hypothetical protein
MLEAAHVACETAAKLASRKAVKECAPPPSKTLHMHCADSTIHAGLRYFPHHTRYVL